MTNKPNKQLRAGTLSVAVWNNTSERGDFNTIQLTKSYKDSQTDEWKSTTSLREQDLPKAALLLQKIFEELSMKEQEVPATEEEK